MITLKEALANVTLATKAQKASDAQKELDKCLEILQETNAYKAWSAAQDAVHDSEEMAALAKAKEVRDDIAQDYKDSAIEYSRRKLRITLLCATREKENHQPLAKNTFSTLGLLLGLCGRMSNHMIQTSTTRKLRNYLPNKKTKKL